MALPFSWPGFTCLQLRQPVPRTLPTLALLPLLQVRSSTCSPSHASAGRGVPPLCPAMRHAHTVPVAALLPKHIRSC